MKENQILVIIKEPGKPPVVEPCFDNTLEAFQKAVGGHTEAVTITANLVLICNAEGRLRGMPRNLNFLGLNFYGPVVAVASKGDEFTSIKASTVPFVLGFMKGADVNEA